MWFQYVLHTNSNLKPPFAIFNNLLNPYAQKDIYKYTYGDSFHYLIKKSTLLLTSTKRCVSNKATQH